MSAKNRFEARHQEDSTPILGRDEELELLLRRWKQATKGRGRIALLIGEARGYRSTRNLKAITYLIVGKLDLRLPT